MRPIGRCSSRRISLKRWRALALLAPHDRGVVGHRLVVDHEAGDAADEEAPFLPLEGVEVGREVAVSATLKSGTQRKSSP
jgi:hypothetical protein